MSDSRDMMWQEVVQDALTQIGGIAHPAEPASSRPRPESCRSVKQETSYYSARMPTSLCSTTWPSSTLGSCRRF